jgi:2-oxoisovalerate dehydrogenase E1 component
VYQDVPIDYYTLPIGRALIKEGNEVTIIVWSSGALGL